jgi:1-deoxy-D-xylulose-5-phosphate reductoisomerase
VLNAANEVAVAAFLDHRIGYDAIVRLVADTVSAAPGVASPSLDDILEADAWARQFSSDRIAKAVSTA